MLVRNVTACAPLRPTAVLTLNVSEQLPPSVGREKESERTNWKDCEDKAVVVN